jgi:hypothetical protein
VTMPTEEVAPLQVELRHPPAARYPFDDPWADEPGPRSPEVVGRPGEWDRVGDILFAPLWYPGVGKLDGTDPNPDGGILTVSPPSRG